MKRKLSLVLSVFVIAVCTAFSFTVYAQNTEQIDISKATVAVPEIGYVYDGQQKMPVPTVTCDNKTLVNNVDYKVSYASNVNAGEGCVYVEGINSYTGTAYAKFQIAPCDLFSSGSNVSVSLSQTSFDYTGAAITPAVTVKLGNTVLKNGVDYTVSYANNVDAGTASVTVTGKGNFCSSVSRNYTIKKLNLAKKGKATLSFDSTSFVYNGSAVKPVVYISYAIGDGAQYLAQDVDFKVSYSNNTKIGTATAKVTGLGNYTGTISKKFKILPAKVSNVSVSDVTTSSLVLKWNKVSSVSGYDVAVYDSQKKDYKHLAYVSSKYSSYKATKLTSAKSYKFKIRAYKTVDGKKYYGEYSNEAGSLVKPQKVNIASVTKSGKKLTIDWKGVKCSGYQVFYSTDKNLKKNVKSVFVSSKKNTYTVNKIDKSKRYYVRVRAYSNYNGKKYYGEKSAKVSSYFSNVYATYSSNYVNNANRTTNLKVASKAISGTIVNPGETFSLNKVVGPRTAKRGYKEAPVFTGTTGVENGLGGGICQVASTLFNCALRANVTITERHQHSQRVSYVPLGRDAAIYGTIEDFKWTNNTKYPIKISMTVKNGVITCTFYTCEKVSPKKVDLNVNQKGDKFTLKRSVNGKVNYTTYSTY